MYVEPIVPIKMMESQTDEGGPTPTPTDKESPSQTQKRCRTNEGCPTQNDKGSRTEKDCPTETDKGSRSDKGGPTETDKGSKSDKGGPSQTGKSCRSDKGGPLHDVNYEDFLVDDAFFEDGFCDATTYDGVDVQDLGDRTSESDVSFEVDSDYEQSDDDGLYEANVDEEAEWAGFDNSKGKEPNLNDDLDDDDDGKDYGDDSSDDLHSACSNSDDDRKKDKFHEYRRETDLGKVEFTVGMKFSSVKEFREAVREYSIKEGKDIKPSGRPKKSRRKEREELENPDADKLKRQNTSLRCGKCGQWGHNIRSCKNEVNRDIRRRPSGGLVFSRPTGKPRGRPRQGGSQASSSRGRGLVAAPTEGGQALRGRGGAGRGRGGAGRGKGDGGRGMTDGGRGRGDGGMGRGDGGRGMTDGGRGRTVGRGRGYGRGRASQPTPAATAAASQAPAQ
ncbi:hypothetical protein RHMOL_Rhmol02G0065800 [Rhododendron molle]|uniref:Uncharacterized protein n=1 Tax=Rhododendron molle TaxID=49168 RepID=A0ACC0PMP8_RHOML|nr:hypothetical protein RHMOL_Rhmol02G0065800 [Rhododendron molle]